MTEDFVSVDVSDGFLPRFVGPYLARYGERSEFVRAVADTFTLALGRLLERAGRLPDPDRIARVSDDSAVSALRELIAAVPEIKQPLLQEALGSAPLGSVGQLVDAQLGASVFDRWHAAFESRDFGACASLLRHGQCN